MSRRRRVDRLTYDVSFEPTEWPIPYPLPLPPPPIAAITPLAMRRAESNLPLHVRFLLMHERAALNGEKA